jgi:hypothetical protein
MNKDITLTVDRDGIYLQLTYECEIRRTRNSDDHHKWWEPDVKTTLIRADFTNKNDEEFEWFYGDPKPAAIERAVELYEGHIEELLADKFQEIVNDPNFNEDRYAD